MDIILGASVEESLRMHIMGKTKQIQIRLTVTEYDRIARIAGEEYLTLSAWIRRAILKAVDAHEHDRG